jgi:hypothetical protein
MAGHQGVHLTVCRPSDQLLVPAKREERNVVDGRRVPLRSGRQLREQATACAGWERRRTVSSALRSLLRLQSHSLNLQSSPTVANRSPRGLHAKQLTGDVFELSVAFTLRRFTVATSLLSDCTKLEGLIPLP